MQCYKNRFGTPINWGYLFRHNDDRGMNLLMFDGHVDFLPDWDGIDKYPCHGGRYWNHE